MNRNGTSTVWRGAMTAIATPFASDGAVDYEALRRLVAWQVDSGIHGLVPCGTTGEGATLDDDEHARVIATVAETVGGRVPVIAGCGSNDTRRTVAAAKRAREAGATGLLVVSPYYNKPNRSGMLAHYHAVADATELPIMLYNVPGRTGQNLGSELILELARIERIVAVKEASGNLEQIAAIVESRPSGFGVFSGDDALALPTVALGADGLVSVVSNEAPGEIAALLDAALAGRLDQARAIHYKLLPLMRANFLESNPVTVKTALEILGRCSGRVRSPLGPAAASTVDAVRRALRSGGLGTAGA